MAPSDLMDEEEIDSLTLHSQKSPRIYDRSVKDPIHDYIKLAPRSWDFVDTLQFQRLREIKQLGTSYYVWPGGSHNRFEHCLGVAHLARLQVEHLRKNQPELSISQRDAECVELAGLCHDLGHGPWSHVWDNLFIPKALGGGKKWKHEDASEMMFDHLRKVNNIDISEEDASFIRALIDGNPRRCAPTEKAFLFEIVANKRNGIDVDKFDYIARDSRAIGDTINVSSSRLIHSARVIDNQICYDIKDANQIYELCYTRFSLHKRIYNHKTAKAIEYMIVDALLAAEPYLRIAEQVHKPEKYVYLTDSILSRIESSQEPDLAESRAIIDRIRRRDLYKCVDYKVLGWHLQDMCKEHITPERIVRAARACHFSLSFEANLAGNLASLQPSDVIVDLTQMHYGMKEKNPLDSIRFYSKHNPDSCAPAGEGDISSLMPAVFAEVLLRVYTRHAQYFGIVQAGYRQVLKTMPDSHTWVSSGISDITRVTLSREPSLSELSTMSAVSSGAEPAPAAQKAKARSPFGENSFTTVSPSFVPPNSPALKVKALQSSKRGRELDAAMQEETDLDEVVTVEGGKGFANGKRRRKDGGRDHA